MSHWALTLAKKKINNMNTQHHYQVKVNWVSDRKGIVSSEVLPTTIEVATPPDFPKGMAGI
jgi:organic hydroperoxide reductase OsmC/OhrA